LSHLRMREAKSLLWVMVNSMGESPFVGVSEAGGVKAVVSGTRFGCTAPPTTHPFISQFRLAWVGGARWDTLLRGAGGIVGQ